eukprot:220530_1
MDQLIQLRAGIDSLSKEEFINFIQSNDKTLFAKALFQSFNYQLNQSTNIKQVNGIIQDVQKLNRDVSGIILAREEKNENPKNSDSNIETKLDTLPAVLIGNISSFLCFENILNFEKCSRLIFIGARSPNALYKLESKYFSKCLQVCNQYNTMYYWQRFQQIKELHLNISDCFDIDENWDGYELHTNVKTHYNILSEIPINNICNLTIENWLCNPHNGTYWLDQFIKDLSQTSYIKNIVSFAFHSYDSMVSNSFLNNLLCVVYNENLENINIGADDGEFDVSKIEWLSSLKGISTNMLDIKMPLLNCTKLQSFHSNNNLDQVCLNNLKEICVENPPKSDIDILTFESTEYLKR